MSEGGLCGTPVFVVMLVSTTNRPGDLDGWTLVTDGSGNVIKLSEAVLSTAGVMRLAASRLDSYIHWRNRLAFGW
jgi:hypothetical protein